MIFLHDIDVFCPVSSFFSISVSLSVSLQLFYPDRRTRAVEVSENK